MASLEGFRALYVNVREKRKEEVVKVLDSWFKCKFIRENRPWHANYGANRCRYVAIHRDFYNDFSAESISKEFYSYLYRWPYMSQEELQEVLLELGFVFSSYGSRICIAVPIHEKGTPYTYAQNWVKEINHNYSVYVAHEKKIAEADFDKTINELRDYPSSKIHIAKDHIIFYDYKHPEFEVRGLPRRRFYNRFLKENGISEYIETTHDDYGLVDGTKYIGLRMDASKLNH